MSIRPMRWEGDALLMLDQRGLPVREDWITLDTAHQVAGAIRDMVVRGAPAIGVAAGYGMALAAKAGEDREAAGNELAASRPTAVNLFWAIDRIKALPTFEYATVLAEAQAIEREDLAMNHAMARFGADLIGQGA